MIIQTPNRRRWRNPRALFGLAGFALVIGTLIALLTGQLDGLFNSQPKSTPGIEAVKAVEGADAFSNPTKSVDFQKRDAIIVRHDYPEYYKCGHYPDDQQLTQADLIPTANVVTTITYDSSKHKYVVAGDPRITVTEHVTTEPANSDVDHPFTQQEFVFGFASGVHYFGNYVQHRNSQPGNPFVWGAGPVVYGDRLVNGKTVQNFRLLTYPEDGGSQPQMVIVATDTKTCAAGTTPLPKDFDWARLARNGLLLPEFYMDGAVHPQG